MPRTSLFAAIIALSALALCGAASAHWSADGVGAGSGATGTTVAVSLSVGLPTADLYPGGSADVVLTISNPNASRIQIGELSLDGTQGSGGFAVDGAHSGCLVTAFAFTTQTNGGAGWSVPGRVGNVDGSLAVTLPGSLAMTVNASTACQGVLTTVFLSAGL